MLNNVKLPKSYSLTKLNVGLVTSVKFQIIYFFESCLLNIL